MAVSMNGGSFCRCPCNESPTVVVPAGPRNSQIGGLQRASMFGVDTSYLGTWSLRARVSAVVISACRVWGLSVKAKKVGAWPSSNPTA